MRHRIAILPSEGLLGVFVSDAFGGVVFQCSLHVGYSGLEGGRGEARSSYSSGGQDPPFDVSNVLVEEQLVAGMTGGGGRDPDVAVASGVVGTGLAPPLLDKGGVGLDIGVRVGETRGDVRREEGRKGAAPRRVVPDNGLGPLRGHDKDGPDAELVCVRCSGGVRSRADDAGSSSVNVGVARWAEV